MSNNSAKFYSNDVEFFYCKILEFISYYLEILEGLNLEFLPLLQYQ